MARCAMDSAEVAQRVMTDREIECHLIIDTFSIFEATRATCERKT